MNWYKQAQASISVSIDKWQQSMRDLLEEFVNDDFTMKEYEKSLQELSSQTQQHMQQIAQNINESISRIETWNNSPVIVEARTHDRQNEIDAQVDASVSVGREAGWGGVAGFTYFNDSGKIYIEDVLSAGDEDFFTDPRIESDYFSLIQELKHPGSSNRTGKILTLYTARPTTDRAIYENATTLPHGIYLTNDMDRVAGIAMDLGGSQGMRDIWQVKIDERYLMQTLDAMGSRDYQIVGTNVPVQSIYLVQEGSK